MTGAVVTITLVLIAFGGITLGVVCYFRLQRHRADAAAMAGYHVLAERAVAGQDALRGELTRLTTRVVTVQELPRSVE
jgi:hypothetical protein